MSQNFQVVLAAMLVLIAGYFGYNLLFDDDAVVSLSVVHTQGTVTLIDATGQEETAKPGVILEPNDTVQIGTASSAILAVDEVTNLTLHPESTMQVVGMDASGVRVELEGGRVTARVRPGSPSVAVSNRGRAALAQEAVFQAGVDMEGAFLVDATEGQVQLQGFDGAAELQEGSRVRALPANDAVLGTIPTSLLLEVQWPESATTKEASLILQGRTDPYAQVTVGEDGEQKVIRADADGRFSTTLALKEGVNPLTVSAQDSLGEGAEKKFEVVRDSTAPTATSSEVVWGD